MKNKIKFNTRVVGTTFKNNKFEVSYQDKVNDKILKDDFDFVVVSTGHFSVPFIPEYEGMNSFPGRIMHSHDFRDAEEFRNKNVIVLGSSYSAEDVALQCNKYGAKSVTIGYRHNPMGFKWPKGMKEVHYLDKLEGKKAIFKDGTEQEADVIILCTGYLHHFPFLDENLQLKTKTDFIHLSYIKVWYGKITTNFYILVCKTSFTHSICLIVRLGTLET